MREGSSGDLAHDDVEILEPDHLDRAALVDIDIGRLGLVNPAADLDLAHRSRRETATPRSPAFTSLSGRGILDDSIFCFSEKRCHVFERSESTVATNDNARMISTTIPPVKGP